MLTADTIRGKINTKAYDSKMPYPGNKKFIQERGITSYENV